MDVEKTMEFIRERLAYTAALQAQAKACNSQAEEREVRSERMLADAVRLYLQDLRQERREQREFVKRSGQA
jgi:hypothetical protein